MKKLVKQIIKYPCETATEKQRDRLLKNIINECVNQLDSSQTINADNLQIKYIENQPESGSYYNNTVKLPSDFLLNKERFVFDIMVISHEICHYVQEQTKPKDPLDPTHAKSAFGLLPFRDLLYHIIRINYPEIHNENRKSTLPEKCSKDESLRDMYVNFYSYYFLQPKELQATKFEYNFANNIYNIIMENNLPCDNELLQHLQYDANIDKLTNEIEYQKYIRSHAGFNNFLKGNVYSVKNKFFKENPDIFEKISALKKANYSEAYNGIISLIIDLIVYEYDDDIAHKLYDSISNCQIGVDKYLYLLMMYIRTPLKLNTNDYMTLKKALKEKNKILSGEEWTLEDLENEKIIVNREINKYKDYEKIKEQ